MKSAYRRPTSRSAIPALCSPATCTSHSPTISPTCVIWTSSYASADDLINCAVLKSSSAGVTLCGKNHYGSLGRTPIDGGYYDLHQSLPFIVPGMGKYRAVVDLMGHPDIGGKTL